MTSRTITARTRWYAKSAADVASATYCDLTLHLRDDAKHLIASIPVNDIARIRLKHHVFSNDLVITTRSGTRRCRNLQSRESLEIKQAVEEDQRRTASAKPLARKLARHIEAVHLRIADLLTGKEYVRHSERESLLGLRDEIERLTNRCNCYVQQSLSDDTKAALKRLFKLLEEEVLTGEMETLRHRSNQQYLRRSPPLVKTVTEDLLLPNGLTDEQATAVATDEDVTLVLAGAGTGKTAVITGKTAHLVRNQGVTPGEVLVLAFNKKAAAEIRERLPDDLRGVDVCTFHAFGRHVLAQSTGKQPTVSKLAEDDEHRKSVINETLDEMMNSPRHREVLVNLLAYHRNDYRSPFDFMTADEYYGYVRSTELRTLSGVRVRSLEEVQVANFLSLNGVEFEYEKPYDVDTASARHRQYRPDFFLSDHDIYIEHFALDEEGNPPPCFRNYREGVAWKRTIHEQYGTTLIETYSWQCRKGVLWSELDRKLRRLGVDISPVPIVDLLERLARHRHNWLTGLIATVIKHVKTSSVSPSELRRRAGESERNNAFLDVFEEVLDRYERRLGEEGAVDFEDLINRATEHIGGGRWPVPYRYVLVDEFQDISAGRMALIAALRRTGTAYFLVGDDWQSIYRFAGSDVGLVRDCGNHLGYVCECHLGTTFRYRAGILDPSAAFVQRNPEQTQRRLRTKSTAPDRGITVVAEVSQKEGVGTALDHIRRREGAEGGGDGQGSVSVLALGRYRRSRADTGEPHRDGQLQIDFSTVHAAKGRQADYVLVLDLKNDQYGFPSQIEDDPLLELVLPPSRKPAFRHAEERRLFYVAVTRARRGAYLIADGTNPSSFVEELLRNHPETARIGAGALARSDAFSCPRCGGRLVESQSGKSLRCVNHPLCQHLAPRCAFCDHGHVLIVAGRSECTNDHCDTPPPVCPRCRAGILTRTSGRHGPFLGCSEYRAEPPCGYKELIRA